MLNSFDIDNFSKSNIFQTVAITPDFNARWCCKQFHRVVNSRFIAPVHHFYENSGNLYKEGGKGLYFAPCIYTRFKKFLVKKNLLKRKN